MRELQREQTRQALIRESRRLFAERGYGAVGLAEIVAASGVTKGALYHSFDGKVGLFREVLAQVQGEVADRVSRTVADGDAAADTWGGLLAGCRAFLEVSTEPALARIMLIDGPAVLGWSEWRRLDEQTSARHLEEALREVVAEGVVAPQPVEPLTRLLSGAMNEAALWLAASGTGEDLEHTWVALRRLLESLRLDRAPGDASRRHP